MKALIQRVLKAKVIIDGKEYSGINQGMLILLGVEKNDNSTDIYYVADKSVQFRIFEDENEKMNRSVLDIDGDIMVVSQFTLAANTQKGRRPGFDNAKSPDEAEKMYEEFAKYIKEKYEIDVKTGKFGAYMQVELVNDGPVTFLIESKKQ